MSYFIFVKPSRKQRTESNLQENFFKTALIRVVIVYLTHWHLGQKGFTRAFEVSMGLIANESAKWRHEADEEPALIEPKRETVLLAEKVSSPPEKM